MGMQMLKIKAHPEVYEELKDSRTWYDKKATNLVIGNIESETEQKWIKK